ncbi:MAG TPA: alpha-hydroxy acid oxidase, partial [Micromonosporaceae bacterium]|nr:alpha-hydroxy acid oxidase [Micromonosporaceae bacterium]
MTALIREELHASVTDPVSASMNFLNEIAGRFPDAIVVSNHGGRQVDGAVASLHALPAVAQAVGGRIPVLLDSGVRRGRDVFVALATGADAVLLGRPPLWALATGGADAVRNLMGIVDTELAHLMAIAGRPTLADITPDA